MLTLNLLFSLAVQLEVNKSMDYLISVRMMKPYHPVPLLVSDASQTPDDNEALLT